MVRVEGKTRLSALEVMALAERFYGPGGLGLRTVRRGPDLIVFQGGGGGVYIQVMAGGKDRNVVEVLSREWDEPSKRFLASLA